MRGVATRASPSVMRWAVGGWAFFIGENMLLSENRDKLRTTLGGDENYHLVYGSISTAACASIAYAYLKKVQSAPPLQWPLHASPPAWRLVLAFGLQALGLAGFAQAMPKLQIPYGPAAVDNNSSSAPGAATASEHIGTTPSPAKAWKARCPIDFTKPADDGSVHGAERVSRHLGLWSFASVFLGAAAATPSLPQAAWFAMPTLVALIGGAHTDSRYARGLGGEITPAHAAQTSNVPFVAMLSGAQGPGAFSALLSEAKVVNAALATCAAALWALRRLP